MDVKPNISIFFVEHFWNAILIEIIGLRKIHTNVRQVRIILNSLKTALKHLLYKVFEDFGRKES